MAKRPTPSLKIGKKAASAGQAETYRHPTASSPLRPDVGTQAQFKKKKTPKTYRYDSSLSPALEWDGQNHAREQGEALIAELVGQASSLSKIAAETKNKELTAGTAALRDKAQKLSALSKPFLNWAGKAERLSFDVPTLPLFVHERLSTQAIIETQQGHKKDRQLTMFDFFGDPQHSVADQVLRSYEYQDKWVNRMILGNSLVVMNSLLEYENLGEQVQMIYMDPPYGVKFGSNFQPFVRQKEFGNVDHNNDDSFTREPEMVQAYRDTWEFGLHSYLNYLRDRLLLARNLLAPSGSIFVQISDTNLHHVREVMDEVFGQENFCNVIPFAKTTSPATNLLSEEFDYLLWYARDKQRIKYRQLYLPKTSDTFSSYKYLINPRTTEVRTLSREFRDNPALIPEGFKIAQLSFAVSQDAGKPEEQFYHFKGTRYDCGANRHWKTKNPGGLDRLAAANRLVGMSSQLNYIRFLDDFPATPLTNLWADTGSAGFSNIDPKIYVVQTDRTIVQRCILMTTDPGDLVLDPTCGSGTTAVASEQWGRRWVVIDTSRVPLALARQRLLTATFDWYQLIDEKHGPAGGFAYTRKQNQKGEEVGGIVPHITLESIANNEPPPEEVLVDRPEAIKSITRVTGPFAFEATIPTPADWEDNDAGTAISEEYGSFVERLLEILRRSPLLHLGKETVALTHLRPPAKALSINAEALVDATAPGQKPTLDEAVQESLEKSGKALPLSQKLVALVFGPENAAVSEKLVDEAAREAHAKDYAHLYVIGFAIQANARQLINECAAVVGIPATYVQATPDILMGDLLKNMRSSQIFSVCGLPEVELRKVKSKDGTRYEVELLGLDTFDPVTMAADHKAGQDIPAWLLDTNYNGLCFHVSQAFFPRTGAWENLKKALKGRYEESVWDHLAGTVSAPFEAGEQGQVAVKVIDMRGNELLVVKNLKEAAQ